MSYSFGTASNQPAAQTPAPVPQRSPEQQANRNGCLDVIIQGIGIVSLCILLMVCSCTYMGWSAMNRAKEILSIPDKLFSDGQISQAVEQYKQVYPEVIKPEDRERVLKRIITHEFSTGKKEEAAFWSDISAEEGYDISESVGVEGSEVRQMVENAIKRHREKFKKKKS